MRKRIRFYFTLYLTALPPHYHVLVITKDSPRKLCKMVQKRYGGFARRLPVIKARIAGWIIAQPHGNGWLAVYSPGKASHQPGTSSLTNHMKSAHLHQTESRRKRAAEADAVGKRNLIYCFKRNYHNFIFQNQIEIRREII